MNSNSQQAIRHWTLAQPAISAYVTASVRDFRERDDILQNIAVAVLESFDSYDPKRPFIGWALGIAKNQIGTYYRNRHKSALLLDPEALEQLGTAIERLEEENSRSLEYLHECITKLEKKHCRSVSYATKTAPPNCNLSIVNEPPVPLLLFSNL